MGNAEHTLAYEIARIEQIERQNRIRDHKAKEAARKNDERRTFIVGKIFLESFPEFKNLQPQKTAADNEKEFAPLKHFLTMVKRHGS
jgi:hypothetical protein